ncbi:MAG: hypothetical protein AB7E52_01885 [Bdellovibrionales bacterium]
MAIIIIGIMTITQTKNLLFPLWWKVWIVVLLLVFATPSLMARLIHLPGDEERLHLLQGQKVSEEALDSLYHSRFVTSRWFPENDSYNVLSLVALERAQRSSGEEVKNNLLEADFWERKALAVSPADPYGWYRLAFIYYRMQGPSLSVALAWRESMASAPYEPRLIYPRLQMAMGLGSFLTDEFAKFYVPPLIRDAWNEDPDRLTKLAKEGAFISEVENALRGDPKGLASFRQKLKEF